MQKSRKIPEIKDITKIKFIKKLDKVSLHDDMYKGQKTALSKKNHPNSHKNKQDWFIKQSDGKEHDGSDCS